MIPMNLKILLSAALLFAFGPVALAHETGEKHSHGHDHGHSHGDGHDHGHDHDAPGPNGGTILHQVVPHVELHVTKDRKLQITILDNKLKAAAPGNQTFSVTCGKRLSPVRMTFRKTDQGFISDKALPEGDRIYTVISAKMAPDAEVRTIRLYLTFKS